MFDKEEEIIVFLFVHVIKSLYGVRYFISLHDCKQEQQSPAATLNYLVFMWCRLCVCDQEQEETGFGVFVATGMSLWYHLLPTKTGCRTKWKGHENKI